MPKPKFPEREVLKDVLARLKANILKVETAYRESTDQSYQDSRDLINKIRQGEKKYPDASVGFSALFAVMFRNYSDLVEQSLGVIEDLKIYIESLEKYCAELDKTRWKGIEEATKKMIEKSVKQQEQPMKKEPSYRA